MSEHEKLKQVELADGVGDAIAALISDAAKAGELIWTGDAVQQLRAAMPDTEMTLSELAEAVIREAAARGLPVVMQRVD